MAEAKSRWIRLRSLSGWQWRVLIGSPFVLLLTWVRLRSYGYVKSLEKLKLRRGCDLASEAQLALAKDAAYVLAVAVKCGPWTPKCLVRSMALGWFLARKGIPFEVRIGVPGGVPRNNSDFSAHAWVEHAGVVLNDREDVAVAYKAFL